MPQTGASIGLLPSNFEGHMTRIIDVQSGKTQAPRAAPCPHQVKIHGSSRVVNLMGPPSPEKQSISPQIQPRSSRHLLLQPWLTGKKRRSSASLPRLIWGFGGGSVKYR